MSILQEDFTMYSGVNIPKLGLGTWQVDDSDAERVVTSALKNGYRHIDTALAYGNEVGVGNAVRNSGIDRKSIFVTTKIPAEVKTYDEAKQSIQQSLKNLAIGYIDLLLIHAPKPWSEMFKPEIIKTYNEENLQVWKAMEEAVADGVVKNIGVSNFSIQELQNIMCNSKTKPAVNQVRLCIGDKKEELVAYCQQNDILVEGYSPNATGQLIKKAELVPIAAKYGVSVPQVAIRYVLQKNVLPLPKSVHEEYIVQNSKIDFEITSEDMAFLDAIEG